MPDRIFRPTFAEIDLSALRKNYELVRTKINTKLMPVIKANAYGHGAAKIAKELECLGVEYFGVATIEEGIELRDAGIKSPILILGSIFPMENFEAVIDYGLTPIVASRMAYQKLEKIAEKMEKKVSLHLKVDTGMGRIGVNYSNAAELCNEINESSYLDCSGIFTHFSSADNDPVYTEKQLNNLRNALSDIKVKPEYIHSANTAAIISSEESHFNLVRPGLAIYGLYPEMNTDDYALSPVLSWKSKIVFLKTLQKGSSVSYGNTWIAPRASKIATVCVGYADGYRRILSNRAEVIINDTRCPVVGRVCMDMILVDVTELKRVSTGSEVILIGASATNSISAEEMASWAETINYEITTAISYRVPRVYINENTAK